MLTSEEARTIVQSIPGWESREDLSLRPLEGGLTNQNFIVETAGEVYVLRISGANAAELNIDREGEFEASSAVARAGYAPPVVHFFRPQGHLLKRFIPGEIWGWGDISRPDIMTRAVQTLRSVHRLGPIKAEFSPFGDIDFRLSKAAKLGIAIPDEVAQHRARAADIEQRLWRRPYSDGGLCHNDAFVGNYLATADRVLMIDWEYAGMGDVYYDLAALSITYNIEQKTAMLEEYWGRAPTEAEMMKLNAMRYLNRLWNWTWAIVQMKHGGNDPQYAKMADQLWGMLIKDQAQL